MSAQPDNPYAAPKEESPPSEPEVRPGPRGIGGWLVLPMIRLGFAPLSVGYEVWTNYVPMFTEDMEYMATVDTALAVAKVTSLLGYAALAIAGLYFAFTYSRRFPTAVILFLLFGFVISLGDLALVEIFDWSFTPGEVSRSIESSTVSALIWIPYLLVSKRVKNTFVS